MFWVNSLQSTTFISPRRSFSFCERPDIGSFFVDDGSWSFFCLVFLIFHGLSVPLCGLRSIARAVGRWERVKVHRWDVHHAPSRGVHYAVSGNFHCFMSWIVCSIIGGDVHYIFNWDVHFPESGSFHYTMSGIIHHISNTLIHTIFSLSVTMMQAQNVT